MRSLRAIVFMFIVLTTTSVLANTSELFFSEYVEGSSNNKALEIYNGTGASIDLSADGYTIEIYFNGSTSAGTTLNLTGVVANGDVFIVADVDAAAAILAETDQTSASNFFNGNDAVVFKKGNAVIDVIGQVGTDPGSEWGSGLTSTQNNTLQRRSSVCAGDADGTNAFDPAAEWDGFAQDTFGGLGTHTAQCNGSSSPNVVINEIDADTPGNDTMEFIELYDGGTGNTPLDGLVVVLYNGSDDASYLAFDLDGYATNASGYFVIGSTSESDIIVDPGSSGWLQNGADAVALYTGDAASFPNDTPVTISNLLDAIVYDTDDGDDSGLLMLLNPGEPQINEGGNGDKDHHSNQRCPNGTGGARNTYTYQQFIPTPGADNTCTPSNDGFVMIHDVQGSDLSVTSPGTTVTVEGIVVGDYQGNLELGGFFLQEEDGHTDQDSTTSEGIFVFCGGCTVDVEEGNIVAVTAPQEEFFGMSQLDAAGPGSIVTVVDNGNHLDQITPVEISLPTLGSTTAEGTFEPYEGMLVKFTNTLTATEYFELARFGQVVLSIGGKQRQFTDQNAPDMNGYEAHLDEIAKRRIILDDPDNLQNMDPVYHPQPDGFSRDNFIRGGDTVNGLTGVLHWSWAGFSGTDAWRVRPQRTHPVAFNRANPRPSTPQHVGGNVKIAAFNVLNYFTTIDVTPSNSEGDCSPSGTLDCRGADSQSELDRQTEKIIAALKQIKADIVGLVEIENNAKTSVETLVEALKKAGAGNYQYVDTGTMGTDAIKVAFIYNHTVKAVGNFQILDSTVDGRFIDTLNRPVLIQTFSKGDRRFTVAVAHLKSKGSACDHVGDPDLGDGQGNCNLTRTDAAEALIDYLAIDPTESGDPDFLIIGDLNAYAQEDPITTLESAGFVNLVQEFVGGDAYSYVFDGQWGYLDHALASESMAQQVTGVTEWHINADENNLLDYNDIIADQGEASFEAKPSTTNLFRGDPYRASDHDPIVIGLKPAK